VKEEEIASAEALIAGAEIVILQLEIPHERNAQVVDIANKSGARVILNPAPARAVPDDFYKKIDIVTPNETETEGMVGIYPKDMDTCRQAADAFFKKGVKQVVLTLGENGYYANDGKSDVMVPAYKVASVDTTGAGDCFNGTFAARLAEGDDFFDAAKFASAASALSVTKPGAAVAMPYYDDVVKLMKEQPM
jgi:ribokinase